MTGESYQETYNSFSGVDMQCTFAGKLIGEVQGVSYTVQREKAPLYTMGKASPRGFSRGKRGIAGSLIFLVFNRSAVIEELADAAFYFTPKANVRQRQLARAKDVVEAGQAAVVGTVGSITDTRSVQRVTLEYSYAPAIYADQVPPFNVSITAVNEYGSAAQMDIIGVEILNQGSGMSIDDITTDEACTFVAQDVKPWYNQKTLNPI